MVGHWVKVRSPTLIGNLLILETVLRVYKAETGGFEKLWCYGLKLRQRCVLTRMMRPVNRSFLADLKASEGVKITEPFEVCFKVSAKGRPI